MAGDDLSYVDDATKGDPENYPQVAKLTSGGEKRLAEGYFSWLATLVPTTATGPSQFYRATIVEFYRRPAAATATNMMFTFTALPPGGSAFTISLAPSPLAAEDFRTLLPIGGILLFTDGSTIHEWRRIVVAAPTNVGGMITSIELLVDRDVDAAATTIWAMEGAVGLIEKTVQLEDPSPWTP
jgi:hypothetical protein